MEKEEALKYAEEKGVSIKKIAEIYGYGLTMTRNEIDAMAYDNHTSMMRKAMSY